MGFKARPKPGRDVWVYRRSDRRGSDYIVCMEEPETFTILWGLTGERWTRSSSSKHTAAQGAKPPDSFWDESLGTRIETFCKTGFERVTGKVVTWEDGVVKMRLTLERA